MKRAELSVGDEVVGKYGDRGIVVATEPWAESKQYLGRFGAVGTGRYHPATSGESHNGVAVAVCRSRSPELEVQLVPQIWQLSQTKSADVADEQARLAGIRRLAQRDREAAHAAAINELPDVLHANSVYRGDGIKTNRVEVDLEVLRQFLEGRRALELGAEVLEALELADLVDPETIETVRQSVLENREDGA
jgi:hypothetical protein